MTFNVKSTFTFFSNYFKGLILIGNPFESVVINFRSAKITSLLLFFYIHISFLSFSKKMHTHTTLNTKNKKESLDIKKVCTKINSLYKYTRIAIPLPLIEPNFVKLGAWRFDVNIAFFKMDIILSTIFQRRGIYNKRSRMSIYSSTTFHSRVSICSKYVKKG